MKKASWKIFICLVFTSCMVGSASAQKSLPQNLPSYDHERLHFGFSLGFNRADFLVYPSEEGIKPDSVLTTEALPELGFNLGIISDFMLHNYVTLRFLPSLTFQDRILEYNIHPTNTSNADSFYVAKKRIESTLLDFPLNLKLRSERLNNISAYLLAGGKFSMDLASQAKTKNPDIVKLNGKEWSYDVGFGLDFYLEYFKLSTEMKFSLGRTNRIVPESTAWSSPIDKLFTKTWIFSINFEG